MMYNNSAIRYNIHNSFALGKMGGVGVYGA